MNIWSGDIAESSAGASPRLPPQSPKLQTAWTPQTSPKFKTRNDALAQARVQAIFRSGRFPNTINATSATLGDIEQDALDGLGSEFAFDEVVNRASDIALIQPDFDERALFDTEDSFSSSASSLSSRSTPVHDWTPDWHSYFGVILSSRGREECANACRVLVLSTEWENEQLAELAYQLVSSVQSGVSPLTVTTSAVNIYHMLLDASKHEAASHFTSCVSESAFGAWHHYWNPGTEFSIYPGRPFLVTQQDIDAGYGYCRLLGSLFKARIIPRDSIREIVDLALQNAVLLEHIDALGHLLSYATPEFWAEATDQERDRMVIELYDVMERLCEFHMLRPEFVNEYQKKVEEICTMMVVESS